MIEVARISPTPSFSGVGRGRDLHKIIFLVRYDLRVAW
jgi:hypothetical protein